MKIKELRGLGEEELLQKEKALKADLSKFNMQRYGGRVEKPHMISQVRKDIARIQTILREMREKKNG